MSSSGSSFLFSVGFRSHRNMASAIFRLARSSLFVVSILKSDLFPSGCLDLKDSFWIFEVFSCSDGVPSPSRFPVSLV